MALYLRSQYGVLVMGPQWDHRSLSLSVTLAGQGWILTGGILLRPQILISSANLVPSAIGPYLLPSRHPTCLRR